MSTHITYLHRLASTVVPGRMVHHLLDFIARPVRVFTKNDALLLGGGGQSHEGVTGGRSHVELTVSPPDKSYIMLLLVSLTSLSANRRDNDHVADRGTIVPQRTSSWSFYFS